MCFVDAKLKSSVSIASIVRILHSVTTPSSSKLVKHKDKVKSEVTNYNKSKQSSLGWWEMIKDVNVPVWFEPKMDKHS